MMEVKKTPSVTSIFGGEIGITMFGASEEIIEEDLQSGMEIGMTVAPLLFECAGRHLDEFEDPQIRDFIQVAYDELFKE